MAELNAFLFGFSIAIAIGPIALLIVHNGINHGLGVGVRSGLGAATVDWFYGALALGIGGGLASAVAAHGRIFNLTTSLMLVVLGAWLAWRTLRPANTASSAEQSRAAARLRPGFWMTLVLTIANPLTVLLFVGFSAQLSLGGDIGAVIYYSLWIGLGSVLVNVGLGVCGASIGKWVADRRVITVLNFASGVAIAAFGIHGLMALV